MAGQRVGYQRSRPSDQRTDRQLDGIAVDRIFTDHFSGATRNRPTLEDLRRYVREDDTVVVHSMDRLARTWTTYGHWCGSSPRPGSRWSSSGNT